MEENQTENRQRLLELKVGVFVLLGIAIIAVMILEFGISREGFRKFYHLTVDIPDANGLLKGSDVQLAGARVGYVSEKPRILPTIGAVAIEVKIFDEIKVPRSAHFEVDSSGLLGDRYISIVMAKDFVPSKFNPSDPAQIFLDGAQIEGKRAGGIEELTQKGADVMDALKTALVKLQATTTDLDHRLDLLLSDTNLKNMQATFANLKTTTSSFVDASKDLNVVIQNAQGAIDATKDTMNTANGAAGDLRNAIGDARKVLRRATDGDGVIATLLSNRELGENVKALISNLRQRGLLFYRDTAPRPSASPASKRAPSH